eukprot:CAMPEP_0119541442 /NCGR_PEP_ID=MMETSP1344-20130328/52963_1 /TAXON_ID=236787 /ORGANISM="Florenciella parvula, Strain CCMP2471" /LENGTH=33 /DNA_ID= /DNA_START= /DNA_END= /DNA_ORIENTATION=
MASPGTVGAGSNGFLALALALSLALARALARRA